MDRGYLRLKSSLVFGLQPPEKTEEQKLSCTLLHDEMTVLWKADNIHCINFHFFTSEMTWNTIL